jgi:hypothetical protein
MDNLLKANGAGRKAPVVRLITVIRQVIRYILSLRLRE